MKRREARGVVGEKMPRDGLGLAVVVVIGFIQFVMILQGLRDKGLLKWKD